MSDHLQQGPHEGGCLCGQVRFSVDAAPLGARMCWCRDCQRIASGSATVNVLFPAEAFSFTGEIATYHRSADSGNVVERGFCPECGAQIFSRPLDNPGQPIRL
ncbi:MAG TPA: GFA family protein, partial [Novosphingobium sp.]|nr:GFA family protein [Novosphingobium sp.]